MLEDTIIAIATPPGFGGLGVVRISGRRALAVARKIFEAKAGAKKPIPARHAVFGSVLDPDSRAPLDEAFLTYFRAPRSYTREDVVELSAHGSPAVLEAILRAAIKAGARLARPGEFTLRAYLNGRLDIVQAEAVNDLIRAVSMTQARIASRQLGGSLSRRLARSRAKLVALLAAVEAGLEFPEEGLRPSSSTWGKSLAAAAGDVERLVGSYETGRALSQGLTLALVGRTNVGKSTLFNALLEEDRAIVTPFPGTTRDFLREKVVIGDVVFHLVDMAGWGRPTHPVETRGLAKGRKIAGQADGLIVVLDASRRLSGEDEKLLGRFRSRKAVLVLNKTDLPGRIDKERVRKIAGKDPFVEISALKGTNIEVLRQTVRAHFGPPSIPEEETILHARQRDRLLDALESLLRAGALLAGKYSEEILAEEIRAALGSLGELTGEVRAEEVLEEIFGRFCVGK
jgi:tRNA modification GTPase